MADSKELKIKKGKNPCGRGYGKGSKKRKDK